MKDVDYQYLEIYDEAQRDVMEQALKYRKGVKLQYTRLTEHQLLITWESFMRTGRVLHTKILDRIQYLMAYNTCILQITTACMGHDRFCGVEEMVGAYELNKRQADKLRRVFLDIDEFATWSNGQYFVSDYGLHSLQAYLRAAMEATTYERRLVCLDKMLNVCHQRSDLAELYVEGGTVTLNKLSGEIKEVAV